MADPQRRSGIVYLVGAGPGNPDLITRRGLRALWAADVVAFDRLVAAELLAEAPEDAERVDVGKTPTGAAMGQDETNALLIDRARRGLTVVRLKGGDPFVFGRGGEEAIALADAAVAYEVVPGVTSAVGVPASAGIPLTHRGLAASFVVVTPRSAVDADWGALARIDTVVLMMSVALLREATRSLVAHGRDPKEPAAIVEAGTLDTQRTFTSTLEDIAAVAETHKVRAPATVIIGETVGLRDSILSRNKPAEPAAGG